MDNECHLHRCPVKDAGLRINLRHPSLGHSRKRLEDKPISKFKGRKMPLIQVKLIEGVFSAAKKEEIISKLTDAMVSVEGENMRAVTWVVIEEVKSGQWAIGGQSLTTEAVKTLAAGQGASLVGA